MTQINLLPPQRFIKYQWVVIGISTTLLIVVTSYFFLTHRVSSLSSEPPSINFNTSSQNLLFNYPVHKLKMIGSLKKNSKQNIELMWGLIQSPDKAVTIVKIEDNISHDRLTVTEITSDYIRLQSPQGKKSSFIRVQRHQS